jgi:hypothetical protein
VAVLEVCVFVVVAAHCLAFSHYGYQHKKEPTAIPVEKWNSISLKHITFTPEDSQLG